MAVALYYVDIKEHAIFINTGEPETGHYARHPGLKKTPGYLKRLHRRINPTEPIKPVITDEIAPVYFAERVAPVVTGVHVGTVPSYPKAPQVMTSGLNQL